MANTSQIDTSFPAFLHEAPAWYDPNLLTNYQALPATQEQARYAQMVAERQQEELERMGRRAGIHQFFNEVPPYHQWVQEPKPREPHQFPVAK